MKSTTRRDFLRSAVTLAGAVPLAPPLIHGAIRRGGAWAARVAPPAPSSYRALTSREAAFTEAMARVRCPADHLTPDGVSCGLARFIDRGLAGDLGRAPSTLRPLTVRQFFGEGVVVADEASRLRFGVPFEGLAMTDARAFLRDVSLGRVGDSPFSLASWSKDVVDRLLMQASFSGPVYDRYRGRMFWKLFVSPGDMRSA